VDSEMKLTGQNTAEWFKKITICNSVVHCYVIFCGLFHDAVNNSDKRTCNDRTISGRRIGKDLIRKWSWPKRSIMSEYSSRECILDSWWPGWIWKTAVPNNLLVRQHYYSLLFDVLCFVALFLSVHICLTTSF
jgi:hypothetical protein